MYDIVIKNATVVNEGTTKQCDVAIKNGRFEAIGSDIDTSKTKEIVDAQGKMLMPGIIDDQVHFREPGLTYKADIASESRAAVAGGTTSFMEMPNTKPPSITNEALEAKYAIANQVSPANYSFFLGATNDNVEEVKQVDVKNVCGVKIFMGSSTGNMLVDKQAALEQIFKHTPTLIATHCEDEETIRTNMALFKEKYGDDLNASHHPIIRNAESCYMSSSKASKLAKDNDSRLHILHISTAKELDLFTNSIPLAEKRITSEVCVHHLSFTADDYATLGNKIKCNPAIKAKENREALWAALLDDRLDIIATDHAPHTMEEKANPYSSAPSGLPLVQHSLVMMLQHFRAGRISLEKMVEKMCHTPAECFKVVERGYIREGYFADFVLVDLDKRWTVNKENIAYKCSWSPLEGNEMQGGVDSTYVNGQLVYQNGKIFEVNVGQRLQFNR